ncbi:unnamed protein product [Wuchereria bancrofti]|uniref:Uncharacterized protein n=1 Tax=Wuchereria bancrofti TaxID=6293 RepID=A0A3P7DW34_WUCBA|nr:unnamed protein product [Wuchereria bancrofti]
MCDAKRDRSGPGPAFWSRILYLLLTVTLILHQSFFGALVFLSSNALHLNIWIIIISWMHHIGIDRVFRQLFARRNGVGKRFHCRNLKMQSVASLELWSKLSLGSFEGFLKDPTKKSSGYNVC